MRCDRHGLATGQDGLCVLCRRDERSRRPPTAGANATTAPTWVGPNLLLAAMLAVATAGFLVSRAVAGLGPLAPPPPRLSGLGNAPPSDESNSAELDETEYRAALERVEINVYYAPWCPACKAARAWLQAQRIPYNGFDVQQDPSAARRLRDLNPRGSIPTIEIDGEVAIGFDERRLSKMIDSAVAKRADQL